MGPRAERFVGGLGDFGQRRGECGEVLHHAQRLDGTAGQFGDRLAASLRRSVACATSKGCTNTLGVHARSGNWLGMLRRRAKAVVSRDGAICGHLRCIAGRTQGTVAAALAAAHIITHGNGGSLAPLVIR